MKLFRNERFFCKFNFVRVEQMLFIFVISAKLSNHNNGFSLCQTKDFPARHSKYQWNVKKWHRIQKVGTYEFFVEQFLIFLFLAFSMLNDGTKVFKSKRLFIRLPSARCAVATTFY